MEGAEPQSIIDDVGVFLRDQRLEAGGLLAQAQRLQLAMGLVQDHRRRRLVQLARLDADQPVLDVIDPADAVLAAELVEPFDQRHAVELLAVEADRPAVLEVDVDVSRLVGRLGRVDRPGEGLGRRFVPGIFEDAGLAASAKEVQIDAVRALFCRFDGDAVLGGEGDLLIAAHLPFAHRSDDLQIGASVWKVTSKRT